MTPIDPLTFGVGTSVFVGSNPNKLARSDNGQYIYVGLDGAGAVRRFDLATQTAGLQFSVGSHPMFGPFTAQDIAVMPGSPGTVAIARQISGGSPRNKGVAIFDEGVQRPNTTSIFGPLEDSITFGGSGSVLYGYDNESSGFGFSRMTVSPDGVTINDSQQVFQGFGQRIVYQLGRVYGSFGQIIDPYCPRTCRNATFGGPSNSS